MVGMKASGNEIFFCFFQKGNEKYYLHFLQ